MEGNRQALTDRLTRVEEVSLLKVETSDFGQAVVDTLRATASAFRSAITLLDGAIEQATFEARNAITEMSNCMANAAGVVKEFAGWFFEAAFADLSVLSACRDTINWSYLKPIGQLRRGLPTNNLHSAWVRAVNLQAFTRTGNDIVDSTATAPVATPLTPSDDTPLAARANAVAHGRVDLLDSAHVEPVVTSTYADRQTIEMAVGPLIPAASTAALFCGFAGDWTGVLSFEYAFLAGLFAALLLGLLSTVRDLQNASQARYQHHNPAPTSSTVSRG